MIVLDGKKVSNIIKNKLKVEIDKLIKKPGLGIILVGNNIESKTYVNMKRKTCEYLNIYFICYEFNDDVSENDIITTIQKLNNDDNINGILVQLPLPLHLNTNKILNTISHNKDVEGFHTINAGKLFQNNNYNIVPCTPRGCLELLDHYNINVKSMNVTIIGCSNIVGLPLSILLLQRGATVTICHIDTNDTKSFVKNADLIVACCGVPHLVKKDWIKKDTIIIDVGINKIKNNNGYKLVGDVDYDNVKNICSYITPVPGGVGPMTVAMLMKNVYELSQN